VNTEPLKVLIVDDTPENLIALEALLRRTDIQVISARSGAEALEQCLVHEFVLALLDVQMPEMDGFELAEFMRGSERTKHVPIVFVTAAARDQQRVFRGYESGAVDFLYKPLDPQILTSKVNVFIDLARQRRQLAEALKLNEMFVGILGHDLRNPLSALLNGVQLLSETGADERQLRTLQRMRNAGERMQTMIKDLLDLTHARLGSGLGLARTREQVDVHSVLERTIDELRVVHRRDVLLEGAHSCVTTGDPERLLQLFSNLLGNAIVHGKAGTPVTARIARCEPEVVVEVHNEGVIPTDVRTTLFEPFRRGQPAGGGKRPDGLGLGLFIAKQIAHAHGGDIHVASDEPIGTVFTVRLPQEPPGL
jgi:signal transduction histidine kinase